MDYKKRDCKTLCKILSARLTGHIVIHVYLFVFFIKNKLFESRGCGISRIDLVIPRECLVLCRGLFKGKCMMFYIFLSITDRFDNYENCHFDGVQKYNTSWK